MRLNEKKAVQDRLVKGSGGKKDKEWSLIEDYFDVGIELRRPFEQRWLINLAFFVGRQYSFFNQSAWVLQQLRVVKGKIRNVDNQLLPRVRRQIADGIRNDPVMSVVPNTTDEDDIKAAKVGDKVLRAWWKNNKMGRKRRELKGWVHTTGNGFLDDRWNAKLGPTRFDEKTGAMVYEGDADVGVYGPFEILVPYAALGETDLHDFPWMMKLKWRQLDWIGNGFVKGKNVKAEDLPGLHFDTSHIFGLAAGTGKRKAEGALVKELYIKPCGDYPKGKHLIGANGIVLQEDDYPFNSYNLEHFKDIDIPGVFWGMATMESGVPLQKTWNRTVSGIDEFNRLLGKGKGLVPKGAGLSTLPDDTHGEWIEYKPVMGLKPEIMTLKSLPRTYDLSLDVTRESLRLLFSQQVVTEGTNQSDLRSGDMVQLLLEQNAMGSIPSHAIFEEALEQVVGRVLRRIKKGYSDERTLKITGNEGEFEVFKFKGSDLKNNTDVTIKSESSLPESRVARNMVVERRFKEGFYGDPMDPEVRRHVMNMLDDAIVKDAYADMRLDEQNARIENNTLMSGGMTRLIVNVYDDHMIHMREHTHHMKGREHQKIKEQNPEMFGALERIFLDHVMQHQAFVQQAQQAQEESLVRAEESKKGKKGGKG